jgi:cyclophilin family peptidyl-prolyl cis-trans isomerase/HEAT repeat protein
VVRFACALAATAVLAACPPSAPPVVSAPPNLDALRARVAQAEARRGDGVTELVELATRGTIVERELALRGLGRVGGARARTKLLASLADPDVRVRRAAAEAVCVLASLDELPPEAGAAFTRALVDALPGSRQDLDATIAIVQAIGCAGDASAQKGLVALLSDAHPYVREAAAFAFGRYGRRKIELDAAARPALIDATSDPAIAYAAVYAFAREQLPTGPAAASRERVPAALALRLEDASPVTRALAAQAIAKQNVVGAARRQLERALLDPDWRVAVEAVRALAGDKGDDAGRDAVAAGLARRFAGLERGEPGAAHVVIEALRALAPHARRPPVAAAVAALARGAAASTSVDGVTYGWVECLSLAAMARGADAGGLGPVEGCKLPDHLRLPLVAELIRHGVGPIAARRASLARILAHSDARVRASALGALASLWGEGGEADRDALVSTLASAIGAPEPIVAGSAIEAAPALHEAIGAGAHGALDAAIVARARTERDPELVSAALELIGKRKLAAGADACRGALSAHPAIAAAAKGCLRALGDATPDDPSAEPAAATPPPIDLAVAFGADREWVLETTRGQMAIALEPERAPWAVATIKTLTRKGFYDGLELHRVVPNFVAQGGDPTQSGWGGPGFMLPSEATTAPYVEGSVGIADAGRDSGGSQWFIMHSPARHLDARYTFVGRADRAGAAGALLIGDKVLRATLRTPTQPHPTAR